MVSVSIVSFSKQTGWAVPMCVCQAVRSEKHAQHCLLPSAILAKGLIQLSSGCCFGPSGEKTPSRAEHLLFHSIVWTILWIQSGWWCTYPSEKYESQLGLLFLIYRKIKNVPNHQPVIILS